MAFATKKNALLSQPAVLFRAIRPTTAATIVCLFIYLLAHLQIFNNDSVSFTNDIRWPDNSALYTLGGRCILLLFLFRHLRKYSHENWALIRKWARCGANGFNFWSISTLIFLVLCVFLRGTGCAISVHFKLSVYFFPLRLYMFFSCTVRQSV